MKEQFTRWFCGDGGAVHFAEVLWDACQKWDDAWDGDGNRVAIDNLLAWVAFGKEYHPFFLRNSALLRPALLQMWLSWQAANGLEATRQSDDDIAKAYMLRAGFYQVLHVMAWITGGTDHARVVGPEIFRAYGETLSDLRREFPLMPSAAQPKEGRFDA